MSAPAEKRQKRGGGRPRGARPYREADSLQVETEFRNRNSLRLEVIHPGGRSEETVTFHDDVVDHDDQRMPASPRGADDAAQPSPPPLPDADDYGDQGPADYGGQWPADYDDQCDGLPDQGGWSAAEAYAHLLSNSAYCPLVFVESSRCACTAFPNLYWFLLPWVPRSILSSMCTALSHIFACFRQGMWCVPHHKESRGALSGYHYSLVHLKAIRATSGVYWLVSWCTCRGTASVAEVMFSSQVRFGA